MPRPFCLSALVCLLLLPSCGRIADTSYTLFLKGIYTGSVRLISPEELQESRRRPAQPILLDTRSEEEYRVSHLEGARWVGYDHFDIEQLQDVPRHTPLVVYCSVGYRSERIGEKLQAAGYTKVRNLYGGLFAWVNQGKTVYNDKGETTKVHAYSRAWGVWLRNGEKVYD